MSKPNLLSEKAQEKLLEKKQSTEPVSETNTEIDKEKVENSMKEIMKRLDSEIDKFQRKHSLITQRSIFISKKVILEDFIGKQGTDFNDFDDSKFMVKFKEESYNSEEITIRNNFLVREFAQFLITKIDEKIHQIELQIIA